MDARKEQIKRLKQEIRFLQKVAAILVLKQAPHEIYSFFEKILSNDIEELKSIKEKK